MGNIPEEAFIKMRQDPRLVAVTDLMKKYAKQPALGLLNLRNPEVKEQYRQYCNTKYNGLPIVIGDKIREYCEYREFREALESYVHLWDAILRSEDPEVRLFKTC